MSIYRDKFELNIWFSLTSVLVLGQTQFVGLKFGIFGGFEVCFFQNWAWVWPIFDQTGSNFGFFEGVQKGLKFHFNGRS